MAKIDVRALRLPQRKTETRSFTDPEQPGVEVTLTLRRSLMAEQLAAFDAAAAWWEFNEGADIPIGDDQTFFVGEPENKTDRQAYGTISFIRQVFVICSMQSSPAADRYDELEMIQILCTMPKVANSISAWVNELQNDTGKTDAEGNR